MLINSIGFKPFYNPQNINFKSQHLTEYEQAQRLDGIERHKMNIRNVMGEENYIRVSGKADPSETKKLSYLLNRLDKDSIIIIGNPYTEQTKTDLRNFIDNVPYVNKDIHKVYVIHNEDAQYPVFITTSDKKDVHNNEQFMIHSQGGIKLDTPWWSRAQTTKVKNTRYFGYGDVISIKLDNHYIKLENAKFEKDAPKGISTLDIDEII